MSQQVTQGFRLSPQQRRLWSIQEEDGTSPYRSQCVIRIEGALDRSLLEAAVGDLVARHEILRTLFHRLPGRSWPAQVVLDEEWRPRIELLDLSGREGEVR
ncbi:MAG TPA: condensation domain-containing protein, partial [Thermoanaerobaculia bacterium]|nr:condensation domain-containing protein [Thermoanaerobaculia bacterium]